MANIDLSGVIKAAVTAAVIKVAESPSNSLTQPEVAQAAKTVTAAITPAVEKEATAIITNQTNNEAWYQSRVILGPIVSFASQAAKYAGHEIAAEDQAQLISLISDGVTMLAGLYALYGRLKPNLKPIGE